MKYKILTFFCEMINTNAQYYLPSLSWRLELHIIAFILSTKHNIYFVNLVIFWIGDLQGQFIRKCKR